MARVFKPPKKYGPKTNKKLSPGNEKKSVPTEGDKRENERKG